MEKLIRILGLIALSFILSLLLAFPIMWLWNWLCVDLFHLPAITFWQAFGLNILIHMLWPSSVLYYDHIK